MNTILPIGSVVMLENSTKPFMIFGYLQETSTLENGLFDYIGVPYPEGNVNISNQIGFQMTNITEVLFEGYKTDEFQTIAALLQLAGARHMVDEEENAKE